jgi:hypothetical protein
MPVCTILELFVILVSHKIHHSWKSFICIGICLEYRDLLFASSFFFFWDEISCMIDQLYGLGLWL